jgi:hypothetical protein
MQRTALLLMRVNGDCSGLRGPVGAAGRPGEAARPARRPACEHRRIRPAPSVRRPGSYSRYDEASSMPAPRPKPSPAIRIGSDDPAYSQAHDGRARQASQPQPGDGAADDRHGPPFRNIALVHNATYCTLRAYLSPMSHHARQTVASHCRTLNVHDHDATPLASGIAASSMTSSAAMAPPGLAGDGRLAPSPLCSGDRVRLTRAGSRGRCNSAGRWHFPR